MKTSCQQMVVTPSTDNGSLGMNVGHSNKKEIEFFTKKETEFFTNEQNAHTQC